MERIPFTITPTSITLVLDRRHRQLNNTHMNFVAVKDALKRLDAVRLADDAQAYEIVLDQLRGFVDIPSFIAIVTEGRVEVGDKGVRFDGQPLSGHFTDRLVHLLSEGFDVRPLARMLERLEKAPIADAKDGFLRWLEKSNMPLCEDGSFTAYKYVRSDYKDGHSGTVDNHVGAVVPRFEVDSINTNREETCAASGYHFCSYGYNYLTGSNRHIMIVKIAPEDVASFPDSEEQKGRCLFYQIVDELDETAHQARGIEQTAVYGATPPEFSTGGDNGYGVEEEEEHEDEADDEAGDEEAEGDTVDFGSSDDPEPVVRKRTEQKKGGTLTPKERWLARLRATQVGGKPLTQARISKLVATKGQREVARLTGIPRTTLQDWVD